MTNIPVIETERLRLRAHTLGDFEVLAATWADPAVVRHIGAPSTRTDSWSRLLRYRGHWALMGFGLWAIEEKQTGRYLGDLGLAEFQRDIQPSFEGTPEAGWAFATAAGGKGYATEALRTALQWADANLSAPKTCCIITPENLASVRVAEKCGFRKVREAIHGDHPVGVFERLRNA